LATTFCERDNSDHAYGPTTYVYYNHNGGKPDSLEVLVIQTLHKAY